MDTLTKILPVHMTPLAQSETDTNTVVVPTLGLFLRDDVSQLPEGEGLTAPEASPEKMHEQEVQDQTDFAPQVLSQVLVPDYITVHLGAPTNTAARNVRVPFRDYIKNVVSHEIYSTWPTNALLANIHAIVSFALNRIFTEWYRGRGYNFDITNNTNYDMNYVDGGGYYQNISQLVDQYFNVYAHRYGFANPILALFCAGTSGSCQHGGMPQWGTVNLANQGYTPLQILRRYYGNDIVLSESNNIGAITESFPGTNLSIGSSGNNVRRMQNFLNRIRVNYPAIPRILTPNGVFGADTAAAVREYQRINNLPQTGIIDRATWNSISQKYVAVAKLGELDSEGERISIGQNPPNVTLSMGSRGQNVLELQFILNTIAAYYDSVPFVVQDGVFDAITRTSVIEFQKTFGLPQDGVVGATTWNRLYEIYRGIQGNVTVPPVTPPPIDNLPPYPGSPLRVGSSGANVTTIQQFLNVIRTMYPNIPAVTVDGQFGPATEAAVIAFQRQYLLTPDGIVGPTTWNKIMEQYAIVMGAPQQPAPPPNYFFYTVIAGDSLYLIAQKFNTTVQAIMQLNNLTSTNLSIGQVLMIPGGTTPPPTEITHTVVSGDTLWNLAQRYGTTVQAIMSRNNLTSTNLSIGQTLIIPTSGGTTPPPSGERSHTVVSGDTLWLLAQRYGTTVQAIMQLNGLTSTNLSIGQVLRIPPVSGGGEQARTVVIDPGHGGPNDPGATYQGVRLEKNDNLRLGLAVRNLLQAQGVNVIMTRTTDTAVSLQERSNISNAANPDLFVSLHRNGSTNPNYNGLDIFVYNTAPQSTFQKAQTVANAIASVGVQSNRGVSREDFAVLRNTDAPSMLIELGFMTNAQDNQLFDQNFNAYAQSIANGIISAIGSGSGTGYFNYTVVSGDSLWNIAQRYGTTVQAIMQLNSLTSNNLSIGQVLRIPTA
ncbi:LysM peptidoglycan-binding domain-containing protein [Treponema sp. R6D11]